MSDAYPQPRERTCCCQVGPASTGRLVPVRRVAAPRIGPKPNSIITGTGPCALAGVVSNPVGSNLTGTLQPRQSFNNPSLDVYGGNPNGNWTLLLYNPSGPGDISGIHVNRLARDDYDPIPSEHRIYFRDIYDHLVRVHDITESLRDLIAGALDTYLSAISNRTNDIMKTLTIVTSPAPERSAPTAARCAAPVFPREPPTTRTRP